MYRQTPPYPPYQQPPHSFPQYPLYSQLPYPPYDVEYAPLPKKKGISGGFVALIAVGTFLLGLFCGAMFSAAAHSASTLSAGDLFQYDEFLGNEDSEYFYGLNETASVSGTIYDLSFSPCSFAADITMTSYLRGHAANEKIREMGGDLTDLPEGKEYVAAVFQINLTETDSNSFVMVNPRYFLFDILEDSHDAGLGNYPQNDIVLENLALKPGESGTITAFAVIDQSLPDPDLYFYTDDVFVLFSPQ